MTSGQEREREREKGREGGRRGGEREREREREKEKRYSALSVSTKGSAESQKLRLL